jgi:hypothetical protein
MDGVSRVQNCSLRWSAREGSLRSVVSKVRTGNPHVLRANGRWFRRRNEANTNCPLANFGKEGAELPVIAKVGQEMLARKGFRKLGFNDHNCGIARRWKLVRGTRSLARRELRWGFRTCHQKLG